MQKNSLVFKKDALETIDAPKTMQEAKELLNKHGGLKETLKTMYAQNPSHCLKMYKMMLLDQNDENYINNIIEQYSNLDPVKLVECYKYQLDCLKEIIAGDLIELTEYINS